VVEVLNDLMGQHGIPDSICADIGLAPWTYQPGPINQTSNSAAYSEKLSLQVDQKRGSTPHSIYSQF